MEKEAIWYKDLPRFITLENYDRFFPDSSLTFVEQLNAAMRFALYFAAIVFIIKHDANIVFLPVFVGLFTMFTYQAHYKQKQDSREMLSKLNMGEEPFTDGSYCTLPSKDNPFMNVLITDYAAHPNRPKACNATTPIKKAIKKGFEHNLYRDVGDVFSNQSSDRQFYTMPSTSIPNDAVGFAKWLYGTGKTCKEGNGDQCYRNTFRAMTM